jgi:O-antigen/teichoic acid export membrane protein
MSSSFLKNTSKLLTGNAIGQIVGIIAIPIITRLYSVEVYGAFSAILAISIILSTLSTLSLHLAILIPKSDVEAKKILYLSFGFMTVFCMILTSILLVFSSDILTALGMASVKWMIYTIPILVLLQSSYLILTYWGVRHKSFGMVSSSKITEGVTDRSIAIIAGMAGYVSSQSLIFARLLSNIVSIFYLMPLFRKSTETTKTVQKEIISYKSTILKYRFYLQYNAPSMLLISSMMQLPVIMLAAYFSPVSAGLYAIANRVVNIPVAALGSAISQTYTQKIAVDISNNNLKKVQVDTDNFFTLLFSFMLIPFSVLSVVGESLFIILLGDKWADAGVLASFLSYLAMTTLLVQGFGGLFDVMNQQKTRLIYHSCNFIVRIGVLFSCVFLEVNLSTTILLFAFFATLMNTIALGLLFSCINRIDILLNALKNNIKPLLFFHGAVIVVEHYSSYLYLSYFFITLTSLVWFLYIGGINKVMKLVRSG